MLRTISTVDHDPLMNETFPELDESIFDTACLDQSWMSEVFDGLPDGNLSQDDLLTDAVSEILKNRIDLPCAEFPNAHDFTDVIIGDEVEINDSLPAAPSQPANVDALCDSSGYTSGTLSSTCLSPSNCSQTTSPETNDSMPLDGNTRLISEFSYHGKKFLPSIIKHSNEPSEPPILTSKRTYIKREIPNSNNRVHLILRHNPSNIQIRNRIIPCNKAGTGQDSAAPSCLYKTLNRPPDLVQTCRDYNIFTESPVFGGSHSSSDSDTNDNSEDDHMHGSEQSRFQCSSRFSKSSASYQRAVSPLSRLPNLKYYDNAGYTYNSARIVPPNLFRAQLPSSRMRSPVRMDRNDAGILVLTSEEKRTLIAEGYTIPTRLPLTKQEERNLKKVRRKIKNKISAQESRRKKKEYLEALERKVNLYSQENVDLRRRVDGLESTNRSLLGQLRLLQQLVNKSKGCHTGNLGTATTPPAGPVKLLNPPTGKSSTNSTTASNSVAGGESGPASTCLMVFALCFVALLVGQPMQPVSQSNTGAALSSATAQLFASRFLGSGSQVDRIWPPADQKMTSPEHQRPNVARNSFLHSSWLSSNYFQWSYSSRVLMPEAPTCVAESTTAKSAVGDDVLSTGPNTIHPVSTSVTSNAVLPTRRMSERKKEPRSRLLGSPSELAECSAPPKRTLWSYLFGDSNVANWGTALGGICTQLEHAAATGLDVLGDQWPPELVTPTPELPVHFRHRLRLNRSGVPLMLPSPEQMMIIANTSWLTISA